MIVKNIKWPTNARIKVLFDTVSWLEILNSYPCLDEKSAIIEILDNRYKCRPLDFEVEKDNDFIGSFIDYKIKDLNALMEKRQFLTQSYGCMIDGFTINTYLKLEKGVLLKQIIKSPSFYYEDERVSYEIIFLTNNLSNTICLGGLNNYLHFENKVEEISYDTALRIVDSFCKNTMRINYFG